MSTRGGPSATAGNVLQPGGDPHSPLRNDESQRAVLVLGPAYLPVELPIMFELINNLRMVAALGLTIPQSVLIRADEVIQ